MRLYRYAAILLLAGCATAQTPAQRVFQIESNYATGLEIAVAYKNLPPCPTVVICSQPKIVKQLQDADDIAFPVLQSAQNVVRLPEAGANAQTAITAADEAVKAMLAITAKLQVK